MKQDNFPFAYMSEVYNEITEKLKKDGAQMSYRTLEKTVGLEQPRLMQLKKGGMYD